MMIVMEHMTLEFLSPIKPMFGMERFQFGVLYYIKILCQHYRIIMQLIKL